MTGGARGGQADPSPMTIVVNSGTLFGRCRRSRARERARVDLEHVELGEEGVGQDWERRLVFVPGRVAERAQRERAELRENATTEQVGEDADVEVVDAAEIKADEGRRKRRALKREDGNAIDRDVLELCRCV